MKAGVGHINHASSVPSAVFLTAGGWFSGALSNFRNPSLWGQQARQDAIGAGIQLPRLLAVAPGWHHNTRTTHKEMTYHYKDGLRRLKALSLAWSLRLRYV